MRRKKNSNCLKLYSGSFLLILFLATGFSAFSQGTKNDSIESKKPKVEHSPRRATIYSAVLPGLGQIYNRKYWKVPLVYGGFATLGYFINFNNEQYTMYRQAYSDIIDNDPNTTSYMKLNVNPNLKLDANILNFTSALKGAKDTWRRNRDLVVISTVAFYALNIIDASVDANFFNFDISDELTINWVPAPVMCMDQKMIGIQCRFTF
jgi:hypothetical protein